METIKSGTVRGRTGDLTVLAQQERDTFRLALVSLDNYAARDVSELNLDDGINDGAVVETVETVEDFFSANDRALNKNGERPNPPRELRRTLVGDLYVWESVQSAKGKRRGSLYVMDFGHARAAYFDGEV